MRQTKPIDPVLVDAAIGNRVAQVPGRETVVVDMEEIA